MASNLINSRTSNKGTNSSTPPTFISKLDNLDSSSSMLPTFITKMDYLGTQLSMSKTRIRQTMIPTFINSNHSTDTNHHMMTQVLTINKGINISTPPTFISKLDNLDISSNILPTSISTMDYLGTQLSTSRARIRHTMIQMFINSKHSSRSMSRIMHTTMPVLINHRGTSRSIA